MIWSIEDSLALRALGHVHVGAISADEELLAA
jgi:hypothetical protein